MKTNEMTPALVAGAKQLLTELDAQRLDPLHPLMIHATPLREAIAEADLFEEHTGGEWALGDHIEIEDDTHYTVGAQRFRPIFTRKGGATIALVLDDEGDPECEPNARLLLAAPKMLSNLREAAAYCESLNGTGPKYDDARSPNGDDFNEIMGWVDAAIAAYEGGK